ncbi:MAG: 30S ribosomal protein S12 methylthiotransferase RimO [Coriobacteriia bacterium]|nr:30S ribosomal protein S12 methylthiotransferase RimO [Coriobacteriia bacterium]
MRNGEHVTALPGSPSIAFLTLGCPKNEVDTDRMRAAVLASAFAVAGSPEDADILVINTCAFIKEATEESICAVLEAAHDWVPAKEGRKLVVAGCMPSRYGDGLAESMPEVAAFVPVNQESELVAALERLVPRAPTCGSGGSSGSDDKGMAKAAAATSKAAAGPEKAGRASRRGRDAVATRTASGVSAYLQISDGCHRRCAFCTIPTIRGPYKSIPLDAIIAEAKQLVRLGAQEIVLIGQDTSSWGRDFGGSAGGTDGVGEAGRGRAGSAGGAGLADVVDAVASVEGVRWLRLMYVQPDGVSDRLLEAMTRHENVCRYLDIPLQHVSGSVLRAMGRSGDAESFMTLIEKIRSALPGAVLRTTLIAGFPGESRSDARELEEFARRASFDYLGVFPFSPEEGTAAYGMPSQVPKRTRIARAQRLRDIGDRIGFERAASCVGKVLEVLVEGMDEGEGGWVGRHQGQAPDVDGIVLLAKGQRSGLTSVRITDSLGYDLEGEAVG